MKLMHFQSCLEAASRALTGFPSSLRCPGRKRFHTAVCKATDMTAVSGKPYPTLSTFSKSCTFTIACWGDSW